MNTSITLREQSIRRTLTAAIFGVLVIFISQVGIIHLRLSQLGAIKEPLEKISATCDKLDCVTSWKIKPSHKFLMLGHILRTHELRLEKTDTQIFPASHVRGTAVDSWNGIRVYAVNPGETYILTATKPKAVRMPHFIGILPRSSYHEGILSIPDIGPTIATISFFSGFGILIFLIFAAYTSPNETSSSPTKREDLALISFAGIFVFISSSFASGMIDSLLPDGEFRSQLLRVSFLTCLTMLPLSFIIRPIIRNPWMRLLSIPVMITVLVMGNWHLFRAGITWSLALTIGILTTAFYLAFIRKSWTATFSILIGLHDPISIAGFRINDVPPIYLLIVSILAAMSILAADLGATSVIALASKAYQRFTRDIILRNLSTQLSSQLSGTNISSHDDFKNILLQIGKLTGAGRVSILINMPFGRPVTHTLDVIGQRFITHDDGRIPGAVTIRALVYGDQCWYENYNVFAVRLGLPINPNLNSNGYTCIAPIRVHQNNIGVLMLTSFDDQHIAKIVKNGLIEEEREAGRDIIETIESVFSEALIHHMKSHSEISASLLTQIREAIPASNSVDEFLQKFSTIIFHTTNLKTMIHKRDHNRGEAICAAGIDPSNWEKFLQNPFNLEASSIQAVGSTVVAFKEGRSSYVKDWHEIREKLHPRTIDLLEHLEVRSLLAVPLKNGHQDYVVTMFSNLNDPPKDPGIIEAIEATDAIFDAAMTVLGQRTSVLALGKLANRLIGDDVVRDQIVQAAKAEDLPTTIGAPRRSFLLLFDLMGSSNLPADTEDKAKAYGIFYDEINGAVQSLLGGKIRKTIGDAIIATWDGTGNEIESKPDFLSNLARVVEHADKVAMSVGCDGVRVVLHHGDYFFGLVGTSSFGQIDVIGRGIDEVCKIEGSMKGLFIGDAKIKVGISSTAAERLTLLRAEDLWAENYVLIDAEPSEHSKHSQMLKWGCVSVNEHPRPFEGVTETIISTRYRAA